jgi:hypothetical protein
MRGKRRMKTITLPDVDLPPEVAHELSWWLFGLAHEFDMHYQDEIRTHLERVSAQRDELESLSDEEVSD